MRSFDVCMPFHPKDAGTTAIAVRQLRTVFGSDLKRIFVVSREDPRIESATWMSEENWPIPSLEQITGRWRQQYEQSAPRAGWLFQQFIKLAVEERIPDISDPFMVCDSDFLFVHNPYYDVPRGAWPYSRAYNNQRWDPYVEHFNRLLGFYPPAPMSFINHHMFFGHEILAELKRFIEARHQTSWHAAILNTVDYRVESNFSEYDLYGNWMYAKHRDRTWSVALRIAETTMLPGACCLHMAVSAKMDAVSCQEWNRTVPGATHWA